jgi:excisionase family DNA binding protein
MMFCDNPMSEAERPRPVFYTVAEVSSQCKVSERTVRRWIKAGTLSKVPLPGRLVRISSDELRRLAGQQER